MLHKRPQPAGAEMSSLLPGQALPLDDDGQPSAAAGAAGGSPPAFSTSKYVVPPSPSVDPRARLPPLDNTSSPSAEEAPEPEVAAVADAKAKEETSVNEKRETSGWNKVRDRVLRDTHRDKQEIFLSGLSIEDLQVRAEAKGIEYDENTSAEILIATLLAKADQDDERHRPLSELSIEDLKVHAEAAGIDVENVSSEDLRDALIDELEQLAKESENGRLTLTGQKSQPPASSPSPLRAQHNWGRVRQKVSAIGEAAVFLLHDAKRLFTAQNPKIRSEHLSKVLAAEEKFKDAHRGCMFHPEHDRKRQGWDLFITVILLYVAISVPIRIGFDAPVKPWWNVAFMFDVFVDVAFIIDIVLTFRTAYYNKEGHLVSAPKEIAKNYFKTWLFVDVLASLPVTYVTPSTWSPSDNTGSSAASNFKGFRVVRLFRLAKMLRLLRFKKLYERYEDELEPFLRTLSIAKVLVLNVFIAHIGGCLWHYVGLPYSTDSCFNTNGTRKQLLGGCDPPTDSWLVQTDLLESDTIWKKYVLSFYWAMTTLSTVGYGDIVATTPAEQVVAAATQLIGTAAFAYLTGTLSSLVMAGRLSEQEYNKRMAAIKEYLRVKKVDKPRKTKIINYFTDLYARKTAFDEDKVLEMMPPMMARDLVHHVYKHLHKFLLFRGVADEVVAKLCLELRPYTAHGAYEEQQPAKWNGKKWIWPYDGAVKPLECLKGLLFELSVQELRNHANTRQIQYEVKGKSTRRLKSELVNALVEKEQAAATTMNGEEDSLAMQCLNQKSLNRGPKWNGKHTFVRFCPGEILTQEQTLASEMFVIDTGKCEVKSAGVHLGELANGSFFGEAAVISMGGGPQGTLHTRTIRALTPMDLFFIRREAVRDLCKEYPEFRKRLSKHVCYRRARDRNTVRMTNLQKLLPKKEQVEEHFKKALQEYDKDSSHTLNKEELAEFLRGSGIGANKAQIAMIVSAIDADDDDEINEREFVQAFEALKDPDHENYTNMARIAQGVRDTSEDHFSNPELDYHHKFQPGSQLRTASNPSPVSSLLDNIPSRSDLSPTSSANTTQQFTQIMSELHSLKKDLSSQFKSVNARLDKLETADMDLQGAEEEAETATADMEEHEQEEQLEYGTNAADIAAGNMAAIVAQKCDQ